MGNKPRTYACVSARQPWADLLVAGIKPVENRSWYCSYLGPLLIHAGKTWGKDEQAAHDDLLERAIRAGRQRMINVLTHSRQRLGCLVGVTTMIGCIDEKRWRSHGHQEYDGLDNWFTGPFGWLQANAKYFDPPIPYKGQQGLFRVPVGVVQHYVRRRETDASFLG